MNRVIDIYSKKIYQSCGDLRRTTVVTLRCFCNRHISTTISRLIRDLALTRSGGTPGARTYRSIWT